MNYTFGMGHSCIVIWLYSEAKYIGIFIYLSPYILPLPSENDLQDGSQIKIKLYYNVCETSNMN